MLSIGTTKPAFSSPRFLLLDRGLQLRLGAAVSRLRLCQEACSAAPVSIYFESVTLSKPAPDHRQPSEGILCNTHQFLACALPASLLLQAPQHILGRVGHRRLRPKELF